MASVCKLLHRQGNHWLDSSGTFVILRGTQNGSFVDGGNGNFMTHTDFKFSDHGWNPDWVNDELSTMQSWGFNLLRVQISIELWKNNIDNMREHLRYVIEQANAIGIYIVIVPYSVRYYGQTGHTQNPLPYPPYQDSVEATTIIDSKQAFIDFYSDLTVNFAGNLGILWNVWNEPHNGDLTEYFDVTRQIMVRARSNGADQPFIVNGDWGGIWIEEFAPLARLLPDQNIALELHIYGAYNHLEGVNTYEGIKQKLIDSGVFDCALTYPLHIGECGAEVSNPADYTQIDNLIKICFEEKWDWAVFWLRSDGTFQFVNSDFSPTQVGLIYQKWLRLYQPEPTPPESSMGLLILAGGLGALALSSLLVTR